jgi:hypothetical protein
MTTVSRTTSPVDAASTAGADAAAPLDAAVNATEAPPLPALDLLAAFSAVHGLHKDVQGFAEPRDGGVTDMTAGHRATPADAQGTPLYDKKDVQGAGRKETAKAACNAPAKSYDVNSPTIVDDIKELKRCGHHKLAFTIGRQAVVQGPAGPRPHADLRTTSAGTAASRW